MLAAAGTRHNCGMQRTPGASLAGAAEPLVRYTDMSTLISPITLRSGGQEVIDDGGNSFCAYQVGA
jgi:hypothetical protein